ncbi:hypothetical protein [Paenibacillus alba]|uniref:hypothetical protein n=1 Tax=Paenibacillus alba TaxID=1197127 RepID=UPI00156407BC|nr:hypothetical protein [Paenibacillus alba]
MELQSLKKLLALKETISKVGYLKQRLKLNPVWECFKNKCKATGSVGHFLFVRYDQQNDR